LFCEIINIINFQGSTFDQPVIFISFRGYKNKILFAFSPHYVLEINQSINQSHTNYELQNLLTKQGGVSITVDRSHPDLCALYLSKVNVVPVKRIQNYGVKNGGTMGVQHDLRDQNLTQ
jgi:hypothetical protein